MAARSPTFHVLLRGQMGDASINDCTWMYSSLMRFLGDPEHTDPQKLGQGRT